MNGPGRTAPHQALPYEIICEIVSYISAQPVLHATCLISRRYNSAATPALYRHPLLTSSNLDAFVAAVAPSVAPPSRRYLRSPDYHLADLVLTLDLSRLLYSETQRTSIARLLTHCRSITSLTGSQKSFNGVALRALRHSTKLVHLDLLPCQETCDLTDFFHALTYLPLLTVLHFPRSSLFPTQPNRPRPPQTLLSPPDGASSTIKTTFVYPPNLTTLSVSGGISDSTLLASGNPPASITNLAASHLPFVRMTTLRQYITLLAPNLTRLLVLHPIPRLPHNFLDKILLTCPNLLHLTASVDFLTAHIFDEENCIASHPIEHIDLDCSGGMGSEFKISSDDISIALMEGRLKRLRVVRASVKLGWGRRGEEMRRVKDLAELLCMDRSGFGEEDDDETINGAGEVDEDEMGSSGYFTVDKEKEIMGREEAEVDEISGKLAGVWLF